MQKQPFVFVSNTAKIQEKTDANGSSDDRLRNVGRLRCVPAPALN